MTILGLKRQIKRNFFVILTFKLIAAFYYIISSSTFIDADSGNLYRVLVAHSDLKDVNNRLSFGIGLKTLGWFFFNYISNDILCWIRFSGVLIYLFIINVFFTIKFAFKEMSMLFGVILILIISLSPTIYGYAKLALFGYTLNFLLSSVYLCLFYLWYQDYSRYKFIIISSLSIVSIFLDIRHLLMVESTTVSLLYLEFIKNRRELMSFKNGVNNLKKILIPLFLSIITVVTVLYFFGIHKEALSPRKSILVYYFNFIEEPVLMLVPFLWKNTVSFFASMFFQKDLMLVNNYSFAQVGFSVAFMLISLFYAIFSIINPGRNKFITFLSVYALNSLLCCVVMSSLNLYAYGSIRYQMWNVFPWIIISGGVILEIFKKIDYRKLMLIIVWICLSLYLVKMSFVISKQNNLYTSKKKKIIEVVNNSKCSIIDYVLVQKSKVLNIQTDNKTIITRAWLKGYEKKGEIFKDEIYFLECLKRIGENEKSYLLSTWNYDHSVIVKTLERLKKYDLICRYNSNISTYQLNLFDCSKVND